MPGRRELAGFVWSIACITSDPPPQDSVATITSEEVCLAMAARTRSRAPSGRPLNDAARNGLRLHAAPPSARARLHQHNLLPRLQPQNYLYPDTPADRQMYEHLRDSNYQAWRNYPARAVEDSGQHEILNRMCLMGALSALVGKPRETGLVDTWISTRRRSF
jgi:hypothetical protein